MKKLSVFMCSLAMALCLAGVSRASVISFDVASSPQSGVVVSDMLTLGSTNLTATLAPNLGDTAFTLNDGQTRAVDFFVLGVSGIGAGIAGISATLAFDNPVMSVSGGGGTAWGALGSFNGGLLIWDSSVPDTITLADGNSVRVDFEEGIAVGCGNTAMVHAYVTNLGGGTAPVPEPGTIVLLGAGLAGLGCYGRRRMKIRS